MDSPLSFLPIIGGWFIGVGVVLLTYFIIDTVVESRRRKRYIEHLEHMGEPHRRNIEADEEEDPPWLKEKLKEMGDGKYAILYGMDGSIEIFKLDDEESEENGVTERNKESDGVGEAEEPDRPGV